MIYSETETVIFRKIIPRMFLFGSVTFLITMVDLEGGTDG